MSYFFYDEQASFYIKNANTGKKQVWCDSKDFVIMIKPYPPQPVRQLESS